ncbi:O-antigen ligase family protein [uncultured Jatrophihabitans sp.]|uniref:O-antigen ligase family protein n=1 Tax=uncultured Jatrophihabitans sp. TaxID=1610747 RepID=UPI0035C97C99
MRNEVATVPHDRWRAGQRILCAVLLTVSLVNWRVGDYYAGGFDPVVGAKALLSLIALVLAISALRSTANVPWVGLRTVAISAAYLVVALLGGFAGGDLLANATLVVRVLVVLVTMLCLMMSGSLNEVVGQTSTGLASVGVFLAVTGLPSYAAKGRLYGGILPVNPNGLALLFGPLVLCALWRMLNEHRQRWDPVIFVGLTGATWLTGSRTGLAALLVAVAVIMLVSPHLPAPAVVGLVFAVPAVVYLLYFSPLVSNYFNRGGTQNVTTLNSRTIAWQSALAAPANFWQHWVGRGLGVKEVAVSGTYWNAQILDSSWLSAYVQAGIAGFALLALWVLATLVGSARAPQPHRSLLLGASLYAAINSLLATGLLDAYVLFVVMLLPALGSEIANVQAHTRGSSDPFTP